MTSSVIPISHECEYNQNHCFTTWWSNVSLTNATNAKIVHTAAYANKNMTWTIQSEPRVRLDTVIRENMEKVDGSIIATVMSCQLARKARHAASQERWLVLSR